MPIDLHCHLLPGIDDGARDLDQALAMARLAVADGIRVAVLTPHHLNGVYNNPASDVQRAVATFREALIAEGIGLKVLPGSELHLVPELPGELTAGRAMTIANLGQGSAGRITRTHCPHGHRTDPRTGHCPGPDPDHRSP
jgi:protein-tyrosine phosphatase